MNKEEILRKEIILNYNLDENIAVKRLLISENETYLIETPKEKTAVLRLSRPQYHSLEEINAEMLWLEKLHADTDINVAKPIVDKNGNYVRQVQIGETVYNYVLSKFLKGSEPVADNSEKSSKYYYMLGQITAKLHKQVKNWDGSKKLNRVNWDFENMIGQNAIWGRWQNFEGISKEDEMLIQKASEIIKERLEKYGKNHNNWGLIHSDLRLANILVENDKIKVIDFDDSGFGWFLSDLASSVSFIEHEEIVPMLLKSWLTGYQTIRKLCENDLKQVDTFILLRRLQLMAWLASRENSDPVAQLKLGYLDGTMMLVKRYCSPN